MSDFGEEILNRLSPTTALRNPDNPMYKIINNGLGEWLQAFEEKDFLEQFFLQEATGKYLDLHGGTYDVPRKIDESDEEYRNRIICMVLSHVTVDFLRDVYNVELYTRVPSFDAEDNDLTSDNPFYATSGFMGVADADTQAILNKKFVLGGGVTWL